MSFQLLNFGYSSTPFLQELLDELTVYLPSKVADVRIKPKYEQQLRRQYTEASELQATALGFVKDIEICHMLGCNEVVVKELVADYKGLRQCLTELNTALRKMNQFKELKDHIPKYDAAYTKKCLYDDLTTLKELFNLDFDVKDEMNKPE